MTQSNDNHETLTLDIAKTAVNLCLIYMGRPSVVTPEGVEDLLAWARCQQAILTMRQGATEGGRPYVHLMERDHKPGA
ncbi:MAG: hypothetical protein K2R98_28395 [Gemmataceae bacterium]|nr:hypothetical protein [Gemmataceae bacterium]